MADFKQSYPKHKPFKCNFYWHLRKRGLELAAYELVGAVTLSGKNEFFGSLEKVADYFGTSYGVIHRTFTNLRNKGWLTYDPKHRHYWWVSHEDWAQKHAGQCSVRDLAPYQEETDPFVGRIYAECGGNIRVFEGQVKWFRSLASEDEFVAKLRELTTDAKVRRAAGDKRFTSPKQVLWATADFFKERKHNAASIDPARKRLKDELAAQYPSANLDELLR